jgi:hypothetical protein
MVGVSEGRGVLAKVSKQGLPPLVLRFGIAVCGAGFTATFLPETDIECKAGNLLKYLESRYMQDGKAFTNASDSGLRGL